ncbi:WhiB family transcriptional regulator [Streptomyces sp. A5-4]|uniref:WhiB family transcriptional regulator n=1 Tax=Streptomyces sp. A5-4 TaxID=3384771 RepID=UPI003DA833F0
MESWIERAACTDEDPELFFPVSAEGPGAEQRQQAKAVCAGCPVKQECLHWALTTGQTSGIWGGTCERERAAIRRREGAGGRGRRGAGRETRSPSH